jgi:MFS superfamily sulfate permease-like transporter
MGSLKLLRQETAAGAAAAFVTLPICMTSGALAFSPLGTGYASVGMAAGLYGAIFGSACAALLAGSSFIGSSPRTSLGLIQASFGATIVGGAAITPGAAEVCAAMALCVLCAGLWQILFGLAGVARVIRFTPHPVLAGFLNGAALLIVWGQAKRLLVEPDQRFHLPPLDRFGSIAFVIVLAVVILKLKRLTTKVPAPLAGLVLGVGFFHVMRVAAPTLYLGPTIGDVVIRIIPQSPLAHLANWTTLQWIGGQLPQLLIASLAMAVVGTFETLLTFRVAENLSDLAVRPKRDLVAQGIGNCVSALAGGAGIAAAPSPTTAAFNSGARTRLSGISGAIVLLAFSIMFPQLLAAVPQAVLSSLLIAVGVQLFDRWSLGLLLRILSTGATPERRRARHDLGIVIAVMGITTTLSVAAGIAAGFALACATFVVNMSRPIVRRQYTGLWSKRSRSAEEIAILRATASRRSVLELEGVLFFGNADDLSHTLAKLFGHANTVVLDFRGISDIDISGATILHNSFDRSVRAGKRLLFCNVSPADACIIRTVVTGDKLVVFPDLDSTLEWMEEQALSAEMVGRSRTDLLPLERHDFTRGLDPGERSSLLTYLVKREFPPGTRLVSEGAPVDRMWLFVSGSCSVRLRVDDSRGSRRIASLATGTGTGHGALFGTEERALADIDTDETVICYELDRLAFEAMLDRHPELAAKLLVNVGRELRRRLRTTFDDFRQMRG